MNPLGALALAGTALFMTITEAPATTATMAATTINQKSLLRFMPVAFLEELVHAPIG
jgi:hypothetical protein